MQFDPRAAKLLTPGQHIIVEGCPGLRLERSASAHSWTYRYRSKDTGKLKQVKLGNWPAMPVAKAVAVWSAAKEQRAAGFDPRPAPRQVKVVEPATYPVRDILSAYLEGHIKHARKPESYKEMRRKFEVLAAPLHDMDAEKLTRRDASAYIESLLSTPVQAKLMRQELGAAWDYALDTGRLPQTAVNWWRMVMRRKIRSKGKLVDGRRKVTKRVLTPDEVGELMRWMPNFRSDDVTDLLTLYLLTGCRGGELVQMEGREVSAESDGLWWTCPKEKTKNARFELASDLRVPLAGRAHEIVSRRLGMFGGGYLFPSQRADGTVTHKGQDSVAQAVNYRQPYNKHRPNDGRPRLTVTHWSPHDLRRTARTLLARLGCPMEVAESILGHMLSGVLGIYNLHSYDKERRVWLTRLSDYIEELASGLPARP